MCSSNEDVERVEVLPSRLELRGLRRLPSPSETNWLLAWSTATASCFLWRLFRRVASRLSKSCCRVTSCPERLPRMELVYPMASSGQTSLARSEDVSVNELPSLVALPSDLGLTSFEDTWFGLEIGTLGLVPMIPFRCGTFPNKGCCSAGFDKAATRLVTSESLKPRALLLGRALETILARRCLGLAGCISCSRHPVGLGCCTGTVELIQSVEN